MVDDTQINEDQEFLRLQMDSTREALTQKIELLEEKVTETVESATASVAEATATVMETVQSATASVSQTVGSVTDAVQGTVDSVRHTVEGTVVSVKEAFDLNAHVQQHPWLMLTGAVATGYCIGEFFHDTSRDADGGRLNRASTNFTQASTAGRHRDEGALATRLDRSGNGSHLNGDHTPIPLTSTPVPAAGWWSVLSEKLAPEIAKLGELVLGTALGSFRDMVTPNVPDALQKPLAEIIDDLTEKLGGKCIQGNLLDDHAEPSVNRELPFRIPR